MPGNGPSIKSTAFDAFAIEYDEDFTHSILGRLLRERVWKQLIEHFSAEQHILELTCGTGEDAVWLAKQGVRVTATDGSPQMTQVAQAKVIANGVTESVEVKQVSLQDVTRGHFQGQYFDGVFSNFGGLNTIGDWRALAEALATCVCPGGKVVLVPMGPICPWETFWYLAHGDMITAFRRYRSQTTAVIGDTTIPIWYPSVKQLRVDFAPWFDHISTTSLGLWLPPSYLDQWVNRFPRLFTWLNQFERTTAGWLGGWGDHYVAVFERR